MNIYFPLTFLETSNINDSFQAEKGRTAASDRPQQTFNAFTHRGSACQLNVYTAALKCIIIMKPHHYNVILCMPESSLALPYSLLAFPLLCWKVGIRHHM